MNRLLHRCLAVLTVAAGSLLAQPQAHAASSASYNFDNPYFKPQSNNPTTTRFRIEGKDGAGNLVASSIAVPPPEVAPARFPEP